VATTWFISFDHIHELDTTVTDLLMFIISHIKPIFLFSRYYVMYLD
jgi:hypothetical protein